jgi:hypothetical protein
MSEPHVVNLLWADDDCEHLLNPLGWRFEQNHFRLWKRTNYSEAQDVLKIETIESLLVDIILPYASGAGTLRSNLGMELAGFAAQKGVKCITFLTVVLREEVDDSYKKLEKEYPQVRFEYINKLLLLEPNTIEGLVQSLKPNHA